MLGGLEEDECLDSSLGASGLGVLEIGNGPVFCRDCTAFSLLFSTESAFEDEDDDRGSCGIGEQTSVVFFKT